MSETPDLSDREHKDDIFREGDTVFVTNMKATVTDREVVDHLPDDFPDTGRPPKWCPPRKEDADFVVLTVEMLDPEGGPVETRWTASRLVNNMDYRFSSHGLPSVDGRVGMGVADAPRIGVQTPATGTNDLDPADARDLADFLREHAEFEPLHALLGRTESPEDMHETAQALDRAATTVELAERRQ